MPRSKSSQAWLARRARDPFVKRAKQEGRRSRAIYKLAEIAEREGLFRPGMVVVDLGAAPGGWSQYAHVHTAPGGRVFAVDILPLVAIEGVDFVQGDFTEKPVLDSLMAQLDNRPVDLVMSDMAPNISGVVAADQARSEYLAELALDFAAEVLRPGGAFLLKAFHGKGFPEVQRQMRAQFEKCVTRKPQASRAESREVYLVGTGRKR